MPNAVANRVDLLYVAEVTWGTTPATPALKKLRFTGESLNANIQTVQSAEIRPDRNEQELVQVGARAGGNIEIELSGGGSFDDFLEAVMCSTWVVDGVDANKYTIVPGVTLKAFTIQKRLADVTQFFNFTGARVNTLNFTVEPNKVVTGSFGVMAKQATRAGAQIAGATFPAGTTTTPYNGAAMVTLNQIDGAAIPGGLMKFGLSINNNMREQDVIGQIGPQDIVAGKFEVTGDFEAYFADGTLYDNFINMTEMAIAVNMADDASNAVRVDVPKAKFETCEVVAQGTDTDVMLKATYRGLYDSTTLGSLQLTKDMA